MAGFSVQAPNQSADLLLHESLVSGSIQDNVRTADFSSQRHLRRDAPESLCSRQPIALLQTSDLCFTVGGHDHDFIHALMGAGLEQERHFIHNNGIGIAFWMAGVPGRAVMVKVNAPSAIAPGISRVKGTATPVNLSEQLRQDSATGFKEAAGNLVVNLEQELERFQERVKTSPEEIKVVHKPGYRGGGSLDASAVLLLAGLAGYLLWESRTREARAGMSRP